MEAYLKAKGLKGCAPAEVSGCGSNRVTKLISRSMPCREMQHLTEADVAWHTRAWGRWVLARARKRLASFYPTYSEWARLDGEATHASSSSGGREATGTISENQMPPPRACGCLNRTQTVSPMLISLNTGLDSTYLKYPGNPRWVATPTVAYLWARTVTCKYCRAMLPLLKTCWLCKKDRKRVLLTMDASTDPADVVFGVQNDVPQNGGNAAQRREHDKRIGAGTMSRNGATCPSCGMITTMEDIRFEGRAGRLDAVMTAVVVDGPNGKEYRLPTEHEREVAEISEERLQAVYAEIPFGLPEDPLPSKEALGFRVPLYGFNTWRKLFTNRQLLALGEFVSALRELPDQLAGWPPEWRESLIAGCIPIISRMADRGSTLATWTNDPEKIRSTFARFALPITWDFSESAPLSDTTGGFVQSIDWVFKVYEHLQKSVDTAQKGQCVRGSAITSSSDSVDLIVTDPPYYDAIPYSDLMDFFYVWLRRTVNGLSEDIDAVFSDRLGPKWNHDAGDGELIDDASRFGGDKARSRQNYEDGMADAFESCHAALRSDGRLVVVFANKQPDAWETLVAALIRAGFVVDGSWPIQTEMGNRNRAIASSALSSSVWIVCKKRPTAVPGWDNVVLGEMRSNITRQLRDFWDAGIRGPDFVWAATGPALEAFSKHPVVKKANDPDQLMSVSEFLREVRRMVVDFVVGRVLTHDGEDTISGLDDVTTYYLLHRHDFGMDEAPVGGCILYALSCNLSDTALMNQHDLLAQSGKRGGSEEAEGDGPTGETDETGEGVDDTGGGAKVKLKPWNRRQGRNLGLESPGGRPTPLIDQIHRLMRMWRAGDQVKVDDYLSTRGLQRNILFNQILQALIELAETGSDERSIMEALSNHLATQGDVAPARQGQLQFGEAP